MATWSFSGWRNEVRARCQRDKEGLGGEGQVRGGTGKLRSFAAKRQRNGTISGERGRDKDGFFNHWRS